MRTEIIDYIKGLKLGSYKITDDIPRIESGIPLHLRNPKTIYLNVNEFDEQPLISTLGGCDIHTFTTSVTLTFANDAKRIPNNYDELVGLLIRAKDIDTTTGYNSREATVTTAIENDMLVTQIEYAYVKIR
jgi:hypothetical protein